MPRYPRPPPERTGAFMNRVALPEVAGRTLGELSKRPSALRLWCRACGRDTVITPHGLAALFPTRLDMLAEDFAVAARCQTCGAQEAQACGWTLEVYDPRPMFVRREHARAPLKVRG